MRNWPRFQSAGGRTIGRILLALTMLAGLVGAGAPARAASETGISGNSYTSPKFGYTLEWDDAVWTPLDLSTSDADSLMLLEDRGTLFLDASEATSDDEEACLADKIDEMQASASLSNFEPIRRGYTLPEFDDAGSSELWAYVVTQDDGTEADIVSYFECRYLDDADAMLIITALTNEGLWEDFVPDVEDLMATFDAGSGSSSGGGGKLGKKDKTPTSDDVGLNGNVYTGRFSDFTLTWDANIWVAQEGEDQSADIEQLQLIAEDVGMYLFAVPSTDDPETCLEGLVATSKVTDGISSFRAARRATVPESSPDAVGEVYSYTFTNSDGDEADSIAYFECRSYGDGRMLDIQAIAPAESWEDVAPLVEEVLLAIETDTRADNGDDDNSGRTTGNAGIDGTTYTGSLADYSVTWPKDWEPANNDDAEDGSEGFTLTIQGAYMFFFIYEDPSLDSDQCMSDLIDVVTNESGNERVREVRRPTLPESDRDAVQSAVTYSWTNSDGDVIDLEEYLECREVGDGVWMTIRAGVLEANWEDGLPLFEEVLAGIETRS